MRHMPHTASRFPPVCYSFGLKMMPYTVYRIPVLFLPSSSTFLKREQE